MVWSAPKRMYCEKCGFVSADSEKFKKHMMEKHWCPPLSPYEPLQHNRALTVSLPEEVSIPAGCLVELIEIKTVNGKKELKLRLVSQHPDESPGKDLGAQNTIPGKPSSSTLETSPIKETNTLNESLMDYKVEKDNKEAVQTCSVEQWKLLWRRPKKRKVFPSQTPILAFSDAGVVLYPTPLKVDQLVKQPGPSQPVVVLNHPKPHVLNSHKGTGTAPQVVQKCQIMKMRLRKVVGQKYEVSGCTVRLNPKDHGTSFY
ncbi:uncharacterized protein znf518b [Aplochiton taeniatus]